jgi:hypothetical protein
VLYRDQHVYDVSADPRDPRVLYACGFESSAWRSSDRGEHWARIAGYDFKWSHRVFPDPLDSTMIGRRINMFQSRIATLRAAIVLAAVWSSLYGQGSDLGQIRGTVTDASEAAVPNAKIVISDVATGSSRDITASGSGEFEIGQLKPGSYRITFSAMGLDNLVVNGVQVVSGVVVRADARMNVAKSAESVTVTTEAAAVQTDSPTIAGTLNDQELVELPRDSRDIYEFLYLNPNITQSAGDDGNFKFLGAQSYSASFSLDGQRSNGGVFGQPTNSQPSLETIGELTIMTNNFTAEYAGISNIRVVTKRGEDTITGRCSTITATLRSLRGA